MSYQPFLAHLSHRLNVSFCDCMMSVCHPVSVNNLLFFAGKGLTSWLPFVVSNCEFYHFPIGILGQVWYLIASIPDLCTLTVTASPILLGGNSPNFTEIMLGWSFLSCSKILIPCRISGCQSNQKENK